MKKCVVVAILLTSAAAFAQPAAVPLGTLTGDGSTGGTLAPATVDWYVFSIGTVPYLDFATNGNTIVTDTELGLYDNVGNLIASDDDDGIGLMSVLTFGTGSGLMLGDSFNLGGDGIANGEDGPLGPGTYYLAFGGFNTTFGATGWGATSTSTRQGDYFIDWYTVPEPTSLLLLGLGAVTLIRRR